MRDDDGDGVGVGDGDGDGEGTIPDRAKCMHKEIAQGNCRRRRVPKEIA